MSAVVCVALLGACGQDEDDDDRGAPVTFTSPVYGYSISHPPRWTVVEARRALADGEPPATSTGATDILGRDASERVGTMRPPGVIIAGQPVGEDVGTQEWTSSIMDTVSSMKGCDPPSRRDDVEVDGAPGILLTYPDRPADVGYLHLWAGVVHDGVGYHIVWFNEPGSEAIARRSSSCSRRSRSVIDHRPWRRAARRR
jgi:hypothetical protein